MTFRLSALWLLSLADWGLTAVLLTAGAAEANPLAARLFAVSPWLALAVKQTLIAACCYGMWRLRLERLAAFAAALYFGVVSYELGLLGGR